MKRILSVGLALLLAGCGHAAATSGSAKASKYALRAADGPGALLLIGGGDDVPNILRKFIALAGGNDAPIAIVPFAGGETQGDVTGAALKAQGATNLSVLVGDAAHLASDRALLTGAAAIYFCGGSPDRLMAKWPDYAAATRQAWQAGCAVGGTSAGAMVWGSETIVKGETADLLAGGFDALQLEDGTGWVPGAIVDPHFGARNRFTRLWTAATHEGALGLGIDEETAALLPATGPMEVLGGGSVTVIHPEDGAARVSVVTAGQKLDLTAWRE